MRDHGKRRGGLASSKRPQTCMAALVWRPSIASLDSHQLGHRSFPGRRTLQLCEAGGNGAPPIDIGPEGLGAGGFRRCATKADGA
jgi:hypothetical protein